MADVQKRLRTPDAIDRLRPNHDPQKYSHDKDQQQDVDQLDDLQRHGWVSVDADDPII
jgi:hypothetical protein